MLLKGLAFTIYLTPAHSRLASASFASARRWSLSRVRIAAADEAAGRTAARWATSRGGGSARKCRNAPHSSARAAASAAPNGAERSPGKRTVATA